MPPQKKSIVPRHKALKATLLCMCNCKGISVELFLLQISPDRRSCQELRPGGCWLAEDLGSCQSHSLIMEGKENLRKGRNQDSLHQSNQSHHQPSIAYFATSPLG